MACTDWTAFLTLLDAHRAVVARHFRAGVLRARGRAAPAGRNLGRAKTAAEDSLEPLATLGFREPKALLERLHSFRASSRYLQLPASNRERLDALGPRLIDAAAATTTRRTPPGGAASTFLETISRRGAYLALLQQYPQALKKLAELIGSSSWAADYLTRHPILLDELLDSRMFDLSDRLAGVPRPTCRHAWRSTRTTPSAKWTSCAKPTMRRSSISWRRTWPACTRSNTSPTASANSPTSWCRRPSISAGRSSGSGTRDPSCRRDLPSSPTASSAARNSASLPISISSICTMTRRPTPANSTPASASA
jgi:hypothetical protein